MENNTDIDKVDDLFLHFINAIKNYYNGGDPIIIEQLDHFSILFLNITNSIDSRNVIDYKSFYEFAKSIHESDVDDFYNRQILLRCLFIIEENYTEFYSKYSIEIILLFYDIVKGYSTSIELLSMLHQIKNASLPYDNYIGIQAAYCDRLMKSLYTSYNYPFLLKLECILIDTNQYQQEEGNSQEVNCKVLKDLFSRILIIEKGVVGPTYIVNTSELEGIVKGIRSKLIEVYQLIENSQFGTLLADCQMIYIESIKVIIKSDNSFLDAYLHSILTLCEGCFHKYLIRENNNIIVLNFVKWLLHNANTDFFNHRNVLERIISFFNALYESLKIQEAAQILFNTTPVSNKTLVCVIKLIHFYRSNNVDSVKTLLNVNKTDNELGRRFVLLLLSDEKFEEALEFCNQKLDENQVRNPEGIDDYLRIPEEEGRNIYISYREWYCIKVIEILMHNQSMYKAIEFTISVFLSRGSKGKYSNQFRVECYVLLANQLSHEERDEFFNEIMNNERALHLNDICDICVIEKKWLDFIAAFAKKGNMLGDINWWFSNYKNEFYSFSVELIESYQQAIKTYIEIDSTGETRIRNIKLGLCNLLTVIGGESAVIEILFFGTTKFPQRRNFKNFISTFINENGLSSKFDQYLKSSRSDFEIDSCKPLSVKEYSPWIDKEWAENQIERWKENKSIFEVRESWPKDFSLLSLALSEKILQLCRDAIFYYAERSKKDVLTKSTNILALLKIVGEYKGNRFFLETVISDLQVRYPSRGVQNEMLKDYLKLYNYEFK